MSEFRRPLRSLFEEIAAPIDIDAVMGTNRAADRRRSGWLVAAAAAAIVLVGGGGWLLFAHSSGRPPVTSEPAAAGWALAPSDPASLGGPGLQEMAAVTLGGPGLVAVGMECNDDDCDGAVWVSADGLRWTRVDAPAGVFDGPGNQRIEAVATGGPGLVAVGSEYAPGASEGDAVVWTSPDGRNWLRASGANPDLGGPGDQQMFAVVAGGPGLVAVGGDRVGDQGEGDAAVWVSPDGQDWTRVPDLDSMFGGPSRQDMRSVTTGGPGLVAVGMEFTDRGDRAAVWTSSDGLAWQRAPTDQAALNGDDQPSMQWVMAWDKGLVAVGTAFGSSMLDQRAAVWNSSDGITWTRVSEQEAFDAPGFLIMRQVLVGGEGLVAVGLEYTVVGGTGDAAVWTSADGLWWTRVADTFGDLGGPGYQSMEAVAAWGPGLVAVGTDEYNEEYDAAAWYWPAERSTRTDTRPPEASTSTEPATTTFACPFRQPALPEQDLPAAVAATRERLYRAAINCDFPTLSQLATEAGGIYYPDGVGRAHGDLPGTIEDIAWFVEIADALERPYCVVTGLEEATPGGDTVPTIYQWPAVAEGGACETGFAVGIRDDGRWYGAADSPPSGGRAGP